MPLAPPKRITLVLQVADVLRRGIAHGELSGRLPPEKELAHQLQVSRMTLRAGMKILIREGLIEVAKGRRTLITSPRKISGRGRRTFRVGVITPTTYGDLPFAGYYEIYRTLVQRAGLEVQFFPGSRFYGADPSRLLEKLIPESQIDLWVVCMSTAVLQRWFARQGIPVLVDGSCVTEKPLPALDIDYRALCRHAVGTLRRLGHRRVVYLSAGARTGGDLASEQGFAEGCRLAPALDSSVVICEVSAAAVSRALARLFQSAAPPTAILTGRPGISTATLTYLMNRGLRVPEDVSVISRDDDRSFDFLVPSLARYTFDLNSYARRLAKMTLKHFDGTLRPEQQLIVPNFVNGCSLGSRKSS